MKTIRCFRALGALCAALLALPAHADLLPPVQDSSSLKGKLTPVTGRAVTLPVSASRKAYVLFNLNSLPVDVQAADIMNARLRVYFSAAPKAGDLFLHTVDGTWDEKSIIAEPPISGTVVAMFPTVSVVAKKFAEVDVTATVRAWRDGSLANNGFALNCGGVTSVLLGAKEGSGTGYPCELEVQIDRVTSGNFSGSLTGDVAGTQGATVVTQVGGSTAALIHAAELLVSSATANNTANTLVKRDATGNFSLPFLRTVASQNGPSFLSANIIAGSTVNAVANGVTGAVIAGGGATNGFPQTINANYSSIGGGYSNTIGANGGQSVIAGGVGNSAQAGGVTIAGGQSNTGSGNFATIGGGQSNTASGANSTVPGGANNAASGANSFAAGNRAKATHQGSFVWGDSTNADVNSSAVDQMTIRANGGVVINTTAGVTLNATNGVTMTANAGNTVSVPVGTVYKDNTVVAWGRISTNTLQDSFNVASVVRNSAGNYTVTLNTQFTGTALVPTVSVAYTGTQPTTAAAMRFAATSPLLSNTTFNVYTNNGTFAAADADFTFIVTGR